MKTPLLFLAAVVLGSLAVALRAARRKPRLTLFRWQRQHFNDPRR